MQITRIYIQNLPKTRFIGLKYYDSDRVNGGFGKQWGQAMEDRLFDRIESTSGKEKFYEDSGSYIGLMRCREGEPFEYWIGMFTPPETAVPDGLGHVDFDASTLGIGWLYGSGDELYGHEDDVSKKLVEEGYKIKADEKGAVWFFERYQCQRFTTPDEHGNIILDIGFFVEG